MEITFAFLKRALLPSHNLTDTLSLSGKSSIWQVVIFPTPHFFHISTEKRTFS